MSEDALAKMVDHAMKFAEGVCNVLDYDGMEDVVASYPEKVDELQRLLDQADCSLNRVRQIAAWKEEGRGAVTEPGLLGEPLPPV